MGKRLFITEKPSVAVEFSKALDLKSKTTKDGYIEDGDTIITWCVGHLVNLAMPEDYDEAYKQWKIEDLPLIPNNYKYKVIPDVRKQYNIVAKLLNDPNLSAIYYSGDSAREGEYIQRLVRMMAGRNQNATEYRVWIDSQTKDEILRGIREAKPLSYYDSLSDSAYARAIEDYLVGINFSRALTLQYANLVNKSSPDGKRHPIAIGRVMSCVLGMVVDREREIRNTTVFPFYSVDADLGQGIVAKWKIVEPSAFLNDPSNYENKGLTNKQTAEGLVQFLNQDGTLTVKENKNSSTLKAAPNLFNLAELQAECSKLYHISPSETLEIAQELYEKKLTTYPRTDARVLTTAVCKEIGTNLHGILGDSVVGGFATEVLSNHWEKAIAGNKKYVDDSKVSDHYAIIPTGQTKDIRGLSDLSREVYYLIWKRFLSIFYPAAKYVKQKVTLMQGTETFTAGAEYIEDPGYLKVVGIPETDPNAVHVMAALSGTIPASFALREGQTKPPARYTTGSMILAMENAGKLIEEEELREQIKGSGIGTSATRADTIKKLETNRYIAINKKSQQIAPTKFGELIYDLLKLAVPTILNPRYTASWESGLQMIADKQISKEEYLKKINAYVYGGVASMKEHDYSAELLKAQAELGKVYGEDKPQQGASGVKGATDYVCPICGRPLRESDNAIYCIGYRDKSCEFSVFKSLAGKKIPASAIDKGITTLKAQPEGTMLSDTTNVVKGFTSKNKGTTFDAALQLSVIGGKSRWNFVFNNNYKK